MPSLLQNIDIWKFRRAKKQADYLAEKNNKKFFVFKGEKLVSLLKHLNNSKEYIKYDYAILSRKMIKTLTHNRMRYEDIRNALYIASPPIQKPEILNK